MKKDKIPYLVENKERDTFTFYVKGTKPYLELQQRIDKAIEEIDYMITNADITEISAIKLKQILGDKENE